MRNDRYEIESLRRDDIDMFLALAAEEGWICDRWEFDFLLAAFPQGCLVARIGGAAAAFVTCISYGSSGWIGNLIVRSDHRGKGVGKALMKASLDILAGAGTATVWLTASPAGRSLYEGLGFSEMDSIRRWAGTGVGGGTAPWSAYAMRTLHEQDKAGWGDGRDALISTVAVRGKIISGRDGFLVMQPVGEKVQLGPWCSASGRTAETLLGAALGAAEAGSGLLLDVPAANETAFRLLPGNGFEPAGSASLMYRGRRPAYNPDMIFALATMGSVG